MATSKRGIEAKDDAKLDDSSGGPVGDESRNEIRSFATLTLGIDMR